jgi:hypothetical protein
MGLRPTKGDEDAEWFNSWEAETPGVPCTTNVGQALSPAKSAKKDRVFNGVTMGLRPTKVDEDAKWGRTPWSARVPLDPLFGRRRFPDQADEGVARGPGGPPHLTSSTERNDRPT